MRHRIFWFFFMFGGLMLFMGVGLLLLIPHPVFASSSIQPILTSPLSVNCKPGSVELQCGSQASSCKTCHEVQAKDPVNNDGTGWHESHAFGDFCIFCHAGNDQATDETAAHTGMVPPLSDVKSACQQCHPDDLMEKAQVYATKLNVKIGDGASPTNASAPTNTPAAASGVVQATQTPIIQVQPTVQSAISVPVVNEVVVNDPNAVDYVQRYNEIVLGERPVNWGNIILVSLIGLVIVGGGGFIIFNEMRLRLSATQMKTVTGEYPADVVEMLPALARLKLQTRQVLQHILSNPQKTDKVLNAVDLLVSDEDSKEGTP